MIGMVQVYKVGIFAITLLAAVGVWRAMDQLVCWGLPGLCQ